MHAGGLGRGVIRWGGKKERLGVFLGVKFACIAINGRKLKL
jgi:hypothetical protein